MSRSFSSFLSGKPLSVRTYIATTRSNPALDLAPFGRWTLRDKAAQRP